MDNKELIKTRFNQNISLKKSIVEDNNIIELIENIANQIVMTYKNGGKLWLCGNGGSAADAQHLAAEFSGRFNYDRPPLPAEALHVNTSYLTAVANDYGYEYIYSRIIEAQGEENDILIGFSTSGKSKNIIQALKTAKQKGLITIAFLGSYIADFEPISDYIISIPSNETPRIQETHIFIGHIICEIVESTLFPKA